MARNPLNKPSKTSPRSSGAANGPAPSHSRTLSRRTRTVQPGIKERAEAFLAQSSPIPVKESSTALSKNSAITVSSRKRKRDDAQADNYNAEGGQDVGLLTKPLGGAENTKKGKKEEEKRLRLYRKKAPQSFLEKLSRAQTQRMIVVRRTRSDTPTYPTEYIDIVGSTGNIYRVTIGLQPSCTCPDHRKGNECKHKVYALHKVLKAPEHLEYQLAFLSSELREIFANAPPIPTQDASSNDNDGQRKPTDGECPICYEDLDEKENELVWCKAGCGNSMHKSCFDQWAASQPGAAVKCVYCRTPWETDHGDLQSLIQGVEVDADGYVNVAEQFGMSRARDYTSYHQPWARRQFGMGW